MKTNKSYTKRIKLTKNGKIKVREKGQNHFNGKESGNVTRRKRGVKKDFILSAKRVSQFIPYN